MNSAIKDEPSIPPISVPDDGTPDDPGDSAPPEETLSFSSISSPVTQKANTTFILDLLGSFPEGTTLTFTSDSGTLLGQGKRVNYVADSSYTGPVSVSIKALYGTQEIEQQLTLNLTSPDPTVVIDQVTELAATSEVAASGTFRYRWQGRVLNLANPENYVLGAFQRTPDAYYFMEWYDGTIHPTALPIAADGSFTFTMRRSRRIDAKADRVIFALVPNTVNPYDASHCSSGGCSGSNSAQWKVHLPFSIDLITYHQLNFSPSAYTHANPQIQFLGRQFSPFNTTGSLGFLARSFRDLEHYALYDQALAILALSHAGEKAKAREIALALDYLYVSDDVGTPELEGGWYFSYNFDGSSSYPADGDRRIAGAIAWVVMALNYYQYKFTDAEFQPLAKKTLDYLLGQVDTLTIDGSSYKALRFAPVDFPGGADQSKIYSLEHALDFYSALRFYSDLNSEPSYAERAQEIKQFAQKHWTGTQFYSGYYSPATSFETQESYLDTQTWTILALGARGPANEDYTLGLKYNCTHFFDSAGYLVQDRNTAGIAGFYDMTSVGQAANDKKFVWSEGTLGQILALQTANSNQTCEGRASGDLLQEVDKMVLSDGGVAYATKNDSELFTHSGAIAGAAWYYFVKNGFNPFQIYKLEP